MRISSMYIMGPIDRYTLVSFLVWTVAFIGMALIPETITRKKKDDDK